MPGWRGGLALAALLALAAASSVAAHGAGEQEWLTQGFSTIKDSHDHTHQHAHTHEHSSRGAPLSRTEVWLYGLASSLVVSCAALVCLAAIPFLTRRGVVSEDAASVMTAFGAGAMLGDAFLHQLPHAFNKGSHNHDHAHDHNPSAHAHSLADLSVGLSILAGILLFFLVEVAVRAGSNGHTHHHHHHHGGHHLHDEHVGSVVKTGEGAERVRKRKEGGESKEGEMVVSVGREGEKGVQGGQDRVGLRTLGYLNLFADGVHNFTDGMALGAAFSSRGFAAGWGKTLFMIAHELPQEIGDYGILLRAGFGVMKALLLNFMSALLALFGTAFAIVVGGSNSDTHTHVIDASLLEGFTAGGFMYIALAGVVPDIHANRTSTGMQLVAVLAGMGVALWISTVE